LYKKSNWRGVLPLQKLPLLPPQKSQVSLGSLRLQKFLVFSADPANANFNKASNNHSRGDFVLGSNLADEAIPIGPLQLHQTRGVPPRDNVVRYGFLLLSRELAAAGRPPRTRLRSTALRHRG
jgi:hypothetical protein